MITITKRGENATKGSAMLSVWKSTHKKLLAMAAQTGRSMSEIVDIAVSHVRVGKNGK